MKNEITVIPKIKIHPDKIILYNEVHYHNYKPVRKDQYQQNTTLITKEIDGKLEFVRVSTRFLNSSRKAEGELSKQAIKKLKLSINYFLLLNRPNNKKSGYTGRHYENKIAFITLTLPSKQQHPDNEIKSRCLNQFLIEITHYHKVTNYIWRAEYQKNGNIHFHILVNRFIAWNEVRNRWNRIINKLNYVENYRKELEAYHKEGFKVRTELVKKWPIQQQYNAYLKGKKSDWNSPNSIDVHGLKNITNIKSYLTKYITKNTEKETFEEDINKNNLRESGRIWAASTGFSNITGATTEVDTLIENNLEHIKRTFKERIYESDYFTIISVTIDDLEMLKCLTMIQLFYRYIFDKFQYSYQFSI